jgi:hypothetical protein
MKRSPPTARRKAPTVPQEIEVLQICPSSNGPFDGAATHGWEMRSVIATRLLDKTENFEISHTFRAGLM